MSTAGDSMIQSMRRVVAQGAARWRRRVLFESIGLTIAAPLALLWLLFYLDNRLHLPTWGRLLAATLFLATAGHFLWRTIKALRSLSLTEDQIALAIERRTPGGIHNRLINSIQLARAGDSARWSDAVVRENAAALRQTRLESATQLQPGLIRLALAGVIVLIGVVFFLTAREHFANAAARIFMPFADTAPLYRTRLDIEPGDIRISQGQDVPVRVTIEGRIPDQLTVLLQTHGSSSAAESPALPRAGVRKSSLQIPLEPGQRQATFTLRELEQTTYYAVRGNDFVSRYYRVEVPVPVQLTAVEAEVTYPAYTGKAAQKVRTTGDLEAPRGSTANLVFTFDQPVDSVVMYLERPGSTGETRSDADRAPLRMQGAAYVGHVAFSDVTGYRLETRRGDWPATLSRTYSLHAKPDESPTLELTGLDGVGEAQVDSVLPVHVKARDDWGLRDVGLFWWYRPRTPGSAPGGAPTGAGAQPDDVQPIQVWPMENHPASFESDYNLSVVELGLAEGDRVLVALRARDTDPAKGEQWTSSRSHELLIGGAGAALQVLYERILAGEAALNTLLESQRTAMRDTGLWMAKLDPASGNDFSDESNLQAMRQALGQQREQQAALRELASATARDLVGEADSMRQSLALLADTEYLRAAQILEAAPQRDNNQQVRAALGDARLTQQRIIASLEDIQGRYVSFRQDWELANMMPFVKMLAERQAKMSQESQRYAGSSAEVAQVTAKSMARRQEKVLELSGLSGVALAGMGTRGSVVGPIMAKAFTEAGAALSADSLTAPMRAAVTQVSDGQWTEASASQQQAAEALVAIYAALHEAQAEAARQAMAALRQHEDSDAEAQKAIKALRQGSLEEMLADSGQDIAMEELIRMQKAADEAKKRFEHAGGDLGKDVWDESMKNILYGGMPPKPDFSILRLGDRPSQEHSVPTMSDLEGNKNTLSLIEDQFQDLVGDLLEEAEVLKDQYETYNLNSQGQGVEEGIVGKQASGLSSTSAAAATGNMKPPSGDFGGASRIGRQGARSHGQAVGSESVNRRGMDTAQEGQEDIAYQKGSLREVKSDDPQKDSSVGTGGKMVDSNDPNSFNVKDMGEWKDETAQHMGKVKDKELIVERQGKPLDAKVAEMMRDLESTQEQVIERIKTIRKELKNQYLPTDELDRIAAELTANLDRLKEKPDADVFRRQMQTLDRLRGVLMVFERTRQDFEPSIRREQAVKGRVLDEPAREPLPAYERAIQLYYRKLSDQ